MKHFLSLLDFTRAELEHLLDRAALLRKVRGTPAHPQPLAGKSVALIFEKPSTRTRVSFEVAIRELGGNAIALPARDTQIARGEPIEDTARVLGRYVTRSWRGPTCTGRSRCWPRRAASP